MDKRAIWAIIGFLSAALIGIMLLQAFWINSSLQLSENQFNKNVSIALNEVAGKLQYLESQSALDLVRSDQVSFKRKSTEFFQQEVHQQIKQEGSFVNVETTINQKVQSGSSNSGANVEKYDQDHWELMDLLKHINVIPLEERIDLDALDAFLKREFENKGIDIPYTYGVFSNKERSFVITDGHYVVADDSPQVVQEGYKTLSNSKFKVDLFSQSLESPGLLMVHFPTRASIVWGSVWKTLLGAVLFTGIILFCFGYSVQVIYRQKKVSEMKTDFINNMTHEFKTPIATISLAADSITSPMISSNEAKVKRFADIIKQENKRMLSQVEKVLQMAQIDKREFSLRLTDINLHDVITTAVGNSSLQAGAKGGTVTADLKATKTIIQGDLTHVSNMIHNLLDNANKYSPDKPKISVHTRNVASGVEVIVKDNGIGMTKEARKHIFDKFFRVHTGNIHDVKGFGLGLSYVKAMMTAHKGQIDVKSELGKGSSFILVFPFRVDTE